MKWNLVIQLLDKDDNMVASETSTSNRASWKIPLKTELTKITNKYVTLDWKRIIVGIERADS